MKNFVLHASLSSSLMILLAVSPLLGCKGSTTATDAGAPANNASGSAAPSAPTSGSSGSHNSDSAQGGVASAPVKSAVTLTVPQGVEIHARINETINAKTANLGDPFSGQLTDALSTQSGEVVFPKGTPVAGTVVSAKNEGRFKGAGVLAIEVNKIGDKQVSATEYVVSQKGKGKRTAALIGGGAGAGALIGGLAGGKKGALLGGLLGAGAGTAGAGMTGNKQLVIPAEEVVTFELSRPVSRTVER
jgi:hypothetical protein